MQHQVDNLSKSASIASVSLSFLIDVNKTQSSANSIERCQIFLEVIKKQWSKISLFGSSIFNYNSVK